MKQITQDEIEVYVANADKPNAFSNHSFPLNSLDDRVYEILTYSIFKQRLAAKDVNLINRYDDVILMQGVGEKGMDCILTSGGHISAVIQCKSYAQNLTDTLILTELIKFGIHFILDKLKFVNEKEFKYFIATTTGYSSKAIQLINLLKSRSIEENSNFNKLTLKVIKKYKEFEKIRFAEIKNELPKILYSFEYELIGPSDFDLWINNYPEIIDTFFEIKKVTDNSVIEKKGNEILAKIEESFSTKEKENTAIFIENYKKISIEKLNIVNFIGFDLHRHRQKPTDITLTDLYVQPIFHPKITDENKKAQTISNRDLKISNVFKHERNIILLGDPGAGKSLLVKYIIVQILSGNGEKIGLRQYKNFIPFRIELRKYNEVRDERSILEYLADILVKEYQALINIELLTKLIQQNESIIFFDGLDEIFNVAHKNKVKEAIESFSLNYPKSKCVVTSRFIGYHDIKFNPKKFDEFAIQRFTKRQIEELISNFYTTQILNIEKRRIAISNCVSQIEKEVDEELKSNPLILTLILILASNNIVIPDSKLEIYEACTKTLVDSIDTKEKELTFEMPVRNKRIAFAHLAYWQYEAQSKRQIISYNKAVKAIADLLIDKKEVFDFAEAEEKAKKFLEYAEKRSIYFEDNFTHKTFLEYYTADYLYINYFTKASDAAKKKVLGIITTYLPKSFWYVVFELLLTRIDKEQADTELLDEIFYKQIESNSINVFYFLISNLTKFTNVSEEIRKKIIKKTIFLCIKGEKVTGLRAAGLSFEESSLLAKISLLQNDDNSFMLLQQSIFEFEENGLTEKELIELYIFYFEVISLNSRLKISKKIKINNDKQLEELSYKELHLFCQNNVQKKNKEESLPVDVLLEQIEYFGTKSLFNNLKFRHRENVTRVCTFDVYLISLIESLDYSSFLSGYNKLLKHGIKHEQILKHTESTRLYYFFRDDSFEKVLKFYLKSKNKNIDEIIISLINPDFGTRNFYEKFRSTNGSSKLVAIDKIFERSKSGNLLAGPPRHVSP
ncbi:MAG: NACHT domain-containing protein [Saprospiraceae bacterium]|nr:NACHT domain-containing protein [Saprospiraceae bacterium]